jgi:predicted MFS family arabinose efflux permease
VFSLIRSQTVGWGSIQVFGPLAGAVLLLIVFITVERTVRDPMLDLRLLRVPTFNGGLVSAFAISASIFSLFTYLTIYFQNLLGYSAIGAGLRFLPLTGAIFVVAAIAGRLTTRVPIRALIGVGFAFLVASLLFMRGLTPTDTWTHFLPGFVLGGIGAGLVNVPLASTAVGVVPAERAGMASGINSTLRQVGIATGVAALGTILTSRIKSGMVSQLAGTPLAAHAHALGTAISAGGLTQVAAQVPQQARGLLIHAAKASYVDALNTIFLVAAGVAFIGMVVSFAAIRQRDFDDGGVREPVAV